AVRRVGWLARRRRPAQKSHTWATESDADAVTNEIIGDSGDDSALALGGLSNVVAVLTRFNYSGSGVHQRGRERRRRRRRLRHHRCPWQWPSWRLRLRCWSPEAFCCGSDGTAARASSPGRAKWLGS
ncbi:unnamed protein product, partial [Phaeothamnion confervicola]